MFNKNFTLTSLSSLLWYIASRAELLFLLPFLVYEITESVAWVGIGAFLRLIPMVVSPLFGVTADRLNRKFLLIAINACNGLLMLLVSITIYLRIINIYMLCVLVFLMGLCYPADMLTRRAFISSIVAPKNITRGLSVDIMNFMAGSVLGPIAVGFLLDSTDVGFSYLVMALVYLVGVGTLIPVSVIQSPALNKGSLSLSDLRAVVSYLLSHPPLPTALIIVILANIFIISYQPLISSIGTNELGLSTSLAGFLVSSVYLGGMIGGFLVFINKNIQYHARYMLLAILLMGIGGIGLGTFSSFMPVAGFLLIGGIGIGIWGGTEFAFFIVSSPPHMAGRVLGILLFTISSWPIGIFLIGIIGDLISLQTAVIITSYTGLASSAILACTNKKLLKKTVTASRDPSAGD